MVRALDYHQTRRRPKRRRIPSQGESIPRKIKCGQCGEISNYNRKTCRKKHDGGLKFRILVYLYVVDRVVL